MIKVHKPVPPSQPQPQVTLVTPAASTASAMAPSSVYTPPNSVHDTTAEETLDAIYELLQRFERRHKRARIVAFFRSFIYIAFVAVSSWYVYVHGEDLMVRISQKTAEAAAKFAEERSSDIMQQIRNSLP